MANLRDKIISQSAILAHQTEPNISLSEYIAEYSEQFAENSYNNYLRIWLAYMIEKGCKQAIEIMKDLIRYNLSI